MKVILIGNSAQVKEFTADLPQDQVNLFVVEEIIELQDHKPAVCIDLQFENNKERISKLVNSDADLIFINFVNGTLEKLPQNFIRFNGWNSFLSRAIMEASGANEIHAAAEKIALLFGKKIEWLKDEPGFISCRVVSQIINEAYYSLQENVSSKEEIDTAMKLGTNYPYGPFEWSSIIGLDNIAGLLNTLSLSQKRYLPADSLIKQKTN